MPAFAREASKIWRRISTETYYELKMLKEKWKLLLFCLVCQYFHGVAAKVAHYLHQPGHLLPDIGFRLLPELGPRKVYMSESLFSFLFISFLLWTFHPFVVNSKRIYTVAIWCRVLLMLVASQFLRIISFLSTSLPGPNYHCREGSPAATLPPPKSIAEVVLLNFPNGVIFGCGDLIFSSHMIFILVFIWTYQNYGTKRWIKRLAWLLGVILSFLIVASRKHYTVDVVVAWYTVALVVFFIDRKFPDTENIERTGAGPLLPSVLRAKDGRKEGMDLMNGNHISDSQLDRRQWTPINGKILDDGMPQSIDVASNGI